MVVSSWVVSAQLLVQLVPKVSLGEAQHRSPGAPIQHLKVDQPSRSLLFYDSKYVDTLIDRNI